ncbi:MAG: V-type ATP synthase subunit D [Myxococcota bacterium]|nr:V-type ATP synthase subunit D [Myxococcota bacterium]
MADKIKLNKNTLREQKQSLALFLEFLPTLELRKQQLQTELRKLAVALVKRRQALDELMSSVQSWATMLEKVLPTVQPLVRVDTVEVLQGNIAGVRVPVFQKVRWQELRYTLVATSMIHDAAIAFLKAGLSVREELRVMQEQQRLLEAELVKTTQRINLYEKVLIPETKENIRKIKVYLGDQQTAAVCRAKIAKTKIMLKAAALDAQSEEG